MSFSARSLHRVAAAAPTLPTVYLMQFVSPRQRDGRLPAGARIAGPRMRIVRSHPGTSRGCNAAGHQVHVWTVNEPEDVDCASASAWTPSSPTARTGAAPDSAVRPLTASYRECTGAFAPYSIVTSASRTRGWPVSGPVQWGIHTVAWGEGGLGGGVGGGTGGAHVVEHGRTPWPCGRGGGAAPDARSAARSGVSDTVVDDAVLILSELLSNACRHGRPLGDAPAGRR